MNPALIQALVVLVLIPPTTWLLHRGIQRDVKRWERRQQLMKAAAPVPHFRLMRQAFKEAGEPVARSLNRFAADVNAAMRETKR